eukprot:Pompholyxophrys_punicea_v1_NODE_1144_length_912_cov_2.774796.p2 type:complete len:110 gc:universal NODE_1144_length_912_cov_2.774796:190-519(+)
MLWRSKNSSQIFRVCAALEEGIIISRLKFFKIKNLSSPIKDVHESVLLVSWRQNSILTRHRLASKINLSNISSSSFELGKKEIISSIAAFIKVSDILKNKCKISKMYRQ